MVLTLFFIVFPSGFLRFLFGLPSVCHLYNAVIALSNHGAVSFCPTFYVWDYLSLVLNS